MAEEVQLPVVGGVPKKILIPVGVAVAAFIAWRVWAAQSADDGEVSSITDGEFGAVDTAVPDTINGYPSSFTNSGSTSTTSTGADRDGDGIIGPGEFTNNGQWTEYVTAKLVQSESWSYTDIVTAIGNGLGAKPTTSTQQSILRAAIAVGGQPPSGAITIVSGGDTSLTVAPSGLAVRSVTETSATISFFGVPGAIRYVVKVGNMTGIGASSPVTVTGLAPNSSYSASVTAVSASGTDGPRSSTITVKTKTYNLAKPATPTIKTTTSTGVTASTGAVSGADGYRWYINGAARGYSEAPTITIGGLKAKTKYTITVQADHARQNPGPVSAGRAFTTKK